MAQDVKYPLFPGPVPSGSAAAEGTYAASANPAVSGPSGPSPAAATLLSVLEGTATGNLLAAYSAQDLTIEVLAQNDPAMEDFSDNGEENLKVVTAIASVFSVVAGPAASGLLSKAVQCDIWGVGVGYRVAMASGTNSFPAVVTSGVIVFQRQGYAGAGTARPGLVRLSHDPGAQTNEIAFSQGQPGSYYWSRDDNGTPRAGLAHGQETTWQMLHYWQVSSTEWSYAVSDLSGTYKDIGTATFDNTPTTVPGYAGISFGSGPFSSTNNTVDPILWALHAPYSGTVPGDSDFEDIFDAIVLELP